jgi:hypothetical protein
MLKRMKEYSFQGRHDRTGSDLGVHTLLTNATMRRKKVLKELIYMVVASSDL